METGTMAAAKRVTRPALLMVAALAAVAAAGCTSSGNVKQPTVRSTGQTAPADLQLLCAATATERLGIASGNVLPVSSMPAGGNSYQVNLTFEGGQAVCFISADGTVQGVNRV